MFHLAWLGGEQFVELGILREVIRKGQDDIVEKQQPVNRLGIGHIGKLLRRNVQPLCQYLPVACRLVEHIDEIAIFQDVFDLWGGKQVFGVLGSPSEDTAPLCGTASKSRRCTPRSVPPSAEGEIRQQSTKWSAR